MMMGIGTPSSQSRIPRPIFASMNESPQPVKVELVVFRPGTIFKAPMF